MLPFLPQYRVGYAALASGLAAGFHGAQVKKASDQTAADFTAGYTALAFDTEVFDTLGFHDNASNNTRLTIPSQLNGYYVVVAAHIQIDSLTTNLTASCTIHKNGSTFAGMGSSMRGNGSGSDGSTNRQLIQCRTHVVQVSTGDYFEANLHVGTDTSVTIESDNTYFTLYVVGSSVTGALVRNAADKTAQNYSSITVLTWDTEEYDAASPFHDTGSNTSRFTVPAAYNGRYAIVRASIRLSSVNTAQLAALLIYKGGVEFLGGSVIAGQNGGDLNQWWEATTGPVLLSTGDYYEAAVFSQDNSVTLDANGSFFSIEVLSASFQGVSCKLNANSTANWTTSTPVAWNGTDILDTDAAHDPASNNTKIIIPSAWNGKYGYLIGNMRGTSDMTISLSSSAAFYKNGTLLVGAGGHNGNLGEFSHCIHSPVMLLTTGDEYTCNAWVLTDTSVTIGAAVSNFSLVVVS